MMMPVVSRMYSLASIMSGPACDKYESEELEQQFDGKTLLLGVDDMDTFKSFNLKLLAMERMLTQHPESNGYMADAPPKFLIIDDD